MRFELELPDIGEGVVEGEVTQWHVKPGDSVAEDQPLVEVMTDKATVTIPSPHTGTILETRGEVGDLVKVHSTLIVIETAEDVESARPARDDGAGRSEPEAVAAATPSPTNRSSRIEGTRLVTGLPGEKPLATPATRKLARELDVDLRLVPPTGPGGRVTSDDVRIFARAVAQMAPAPPAPTPGPKRAVSPAAARSDERIPFVGVRRKIAERMATSRRTAAHFTFVEECDMTSLVKTRARLKARAEAEGWKVSYLPFVVRAVVQGLERHPMLNATLDEQSNEIVLRKEYNIGIATATDTGLVVPVVKGADRLSIQETAIEIDRLATDARRGTLAVEDLRGSTFTITSLGAQGGLFATPIINFPEVAILGLHQIKRRPVVRDGQVAIGEVMLVSLSFDHRIVDGHVGAAFAYDVIASLEDPTLMFLDRA